MFSFNFSSKYAFFFFFELSFELCYKPLYKSLHQDAVLVIYFLLQFVLYVYFLYNFSVKPFPGIFCDSDCLKRSYDVHSTVEPGNKISICNVRINKVFIIRKWETVSRVSLYTSAKWFFKEWGVILTVFDLNLGYNYLVSHSHGSLVSCLRWGFLEICHWF